jgi:hypothetical protein
MDTRLAFLEHAVSRMRTALHVVKPLGLGEQRGMSLEQPGELEMPEGTWHGIAQIVRMTAAAHELLTVVQSRYSDGVGTTRVRFTKRRGDSLNQGKHK